MTFSHAGDLGDLIYALPVMRQLSGDQPFDLVLYPTQGMVREPWTAEKFVTLRWLLGAQPYIRKATFEASPRGRVIDEWRRHSPRGRRNLSDQVADVFRVPHWERGRPWIEAQPDVTYPGVDVLIHRSPRYHSNDFPWRAFVERLAGRVAFVGGVHEWDAFCADVGTPFLPYFPTPTVLELARVINGCKLLVCNQSAPRSIGEALAKPVWVEVPRRPDNTHFQRRQAWYRPGDLGTVLNFLGA